MWGYKHKWSEYSFTKAELFLMQGVKIGQLIRWRGEYMKVLGVKPLVVEETRD